MYRRAIGTIICILLVSGTASSVIGTKVMVKTPNVVFYDRDILYVGGSGPNNYTTIQGAIDDASSSDTVFVYNGEYNEHININTTISLIGENKGFTVINGSEIGTVVTVNADYVNIIGFTIEDSGEDYNGIEVNSDYSNISDNIIDNNGYGIRTADADNHTFIGNTFHYHRSGCIRIQNSHNNIISGNNFVDTYGDAISISYSNYSIISDNLLTLPWDGIGTSRCNYLEITNNIVFGRGRRNGISLYYSDYCNISGNKIDYCDRGLWLEYAKYNNVYDNEFTNCDYEGIFLYQRAKFNVISNNIASDNENGGITIWDVSNNNTIYCNTVSSNSYGIYLKYQTNCNNNIIYHNNLIDNSVNAFDGCSNLWNISFPSGGNYWSDYTGFDNDGDGIGDTAINISGGGGNKDNYPLMHPWGEQRPVANYTYFEESGGYVFNASTSYDRDGEVVSYEWDFGDGDTDEGVVVAHSYNETSPYDIILIVTDDEGYKGNITKNIDAIQNFPPDTPSIDGPDSGGWGKPYHFTFQTSDSEGSDVWYFVEWGDGQDTGWMGPYTSGDEISDAHTWTQQETFTIRCKAKDMYNIHSDWGELTIQIPRTRASSFHWLWERFPMLERLLFSL